MYIIIIFLISSKSKKCIIYLFHFTIIKQIGRDSESLRGGELLRDAGAAVVATGRRSASAGVGRPGGGVGLLGLVALRSRLLRLEVPHHRSQLFLLPGLPAPSARCMQHCLLCPINRTRYGFFF